MICELCRRTLEVLLAEDRSGYTVLARVTLTTGARVDVCRLCVSACVDAHARGQPAKPEPEPRRHA